jgi:hypothetical protein
MTKARKSRKEQEALVEWHLKLVLQPLGFSMGDALPYEVRANRVWWFFRTSARFATEAICIPLQWKAPAAITVECFASTLPESDLRERGLRGATAIGSTPYVYLVHRLDRPQQEVLGEIIELGPQDGWTDLFGRVGHELSMIDPGFWEDLLRMWEKRVSTRPTS